jgi:hypothetical protein
MTAFRAPSDRQKPATLALSGAETPGAKRALIGSNADGGILHLIPTP